MRLFFYSSLLFGIFSIYFILPTWGDLDPKDTVYRHQNSLQPPFGGMPPRYWEIGGNTIITESGVRLTDGRPNELGWIRGQRRLRANHWEMRIVFVMGSGSAVGTDGIAVWITPNRKLKEGPIFGMSDIWEGLLIVFDTMFHDSKRQRQDPRIYAIYNDGNLQYDGNWEPHSIGSCSAPIRQMGSSIESVTVLVIYKDGLLRISYDPPKDQEKAAISCFSEKVNLDTDEDYYITISATTGNIFPDMQEVQWFMTWVEEDEENSKKSNLETKSDSDTASSPPVVDQQQPPPPENVNNQNQPPQDTPPNIYPPPPENPQPPPTIPTEDRPSTPENPQPPPTIPTPPAQEIPPLTQDTKPDVNIKPGIIPTEQQRRSVQEQQLPPKEQQPPTPEARRALTDEEADEIFEGISRLQNKRIAIQYSSNRQTAVLQDRLFQLEHNWKVSMNQIEMGLSSFRSTEGVGSDTISSMKSTLSSITSLNRLMEGLEQKIKWSDTHTDQLHEDHAQRMADMAVLLEGGGGWGFWVYLLILQIILGMVYVWCYKKREDVSLGI